MKRLMLVWVMILCLVPLGGWAEETVIKRIDKDEIWSDYNGDEDAFRILEGGWNDYGLTWLRITMLDGSGAVYERDSFPPGCWLDTYHDGDSIIMEYYPEIMVPGDWLGDWGECWFMTFRYTDGVWRLRFISNGWDWTAMVEAGTYLFDDYYFYETDWQWSVTGEDRLLEFDFEEMALMIDQYNTQLPERPSLHDWWEEEDEE